MEGFSGPFRFDIDTQGTEIEKDKISSDIKAALEQVHKLNLDNSKVYFCGIVVAPDAHCVERYHDWSKIKRVCIDVRPATPKIPILGIFPGNIRVEHVRQKQMSFLGGLEATASLFGMARFKLKLSERVKQLAHSGIGGFAVMSFFNRNKAQWVYASAWEQIGYQMYLYVAVPNSITSKDRQIFVSINPLRRHNKSVSQVAVFDHPVKLI